MISPNGNLFVETLAERWWMLVVRGIAAIVFGILTFAVPQSSLFALVILWGAYAIVDGVFALMLAARSGRAGERWGWMLIEGLVGIGAGVVTFVWPQITAIVLLTVIAFWAVLTGVAEVAMAITLRREIKGEWFLALSGLLSMAFGVLLLANPGRGALALAWTIGAYALAFGVMLIALGVKLKRWARSGEHQFPGGGARPTPA
jgi:uncharacterized membrane protein HdeD (DUF308 family)